MTFHTFLILILLKEISTFFDLDKDTNIYTFFKLYAFNSFKYTVDVIKKKQTSKRMIEHLV